MSIWYETAPLYRAADGRMFVYFGPVKRTPFPARYARMRALVGGPCALCRMPLTEPSMELPWRMVLQMEPNGREIIFREVGQREYAHAACTRPISRAGLPLPVIDLTVADLVRRLEALEARVFAS